MSIIKDFDQSKDESTATPENNADREEPPTAVAVNNEIEEPAVDVGTEIEELIIVVGTESEGGPPTAIVLGTAGMHSNQ
jgi:hypothetical protein